MRRNFIKGLKYKRLIFLNYFVSVMYLHLAWKSEWLDSVVMGIPFMLATIIPVCFALAGMGMLLEWVNVDLKASD